MHKHIYNHIYKRTNIYTMNHYIIGVIIIICVLLAFFYKQTENFGAPHTELRFNNDIRIVRTYCDSFTERKYRLAEDMKANTVDAILRLIENHILNADKMRRGNNPTDIAHNCKYIMNTIYD